jgi:MFS family permease
MLGALSGGFFARFGKWNMIMLANLCAALGYGFTIYAHLWAVIVGRVCLGIAIGFYCCFCPKFVNEITPAEYRGPVGSLSQIAVTIGVTVPTAIGLTYDYD